MIRDPWLNKALFRERNGGGKDPRLERFELGRARARGQHNRQKSHCPMGHLYSPQNTLHNSQGSRVCRICKQERRRDMISGFHFKYRFLSNFFPSPILHLDRLWPTVEHAYQASKAINEADRDRIWSSTSPGRAKQLGRRITLRSDWEEIKLSVMLDLLRKKFADPKLGLLLRQTGLDDLIEENSWGDDYWGTVCGIGENHLGRLLMQVRTELKEQAELNAYTK